MRVLVTGGAGFIGSNFVQRSLATRQGISIGVLDSLTYAGSLSNLDGVLSNIDFVHGDVTNSELVDQLVSESDLVVHFAAESHNDNSLINARPFLESNVAGTFELVQACVKHEVRLHHVSTDEVFGDLALGSKERFTEESSYNPSSPYSATKAASDMLVRAWVRSFGLRATISNCSNNYGPFQHEEKFIPRTILLAARGVRPKIYGEGLNVRDWIHVDDHIDGVWAVINNGRLGETYLLGSNGERTNLHVARQVLKELGLSESFLEFVNDRPGHDLRYAIDASKASSELGWKPRHQSFEDGLKSVVNHYLERAEL
jgi:dTDP-glucose 4,6-dehydratase